MARSILVAFVVDKLTSFFNYVTVQKNYLSDMIHISAVLLSYLEFMLLFKENSEKQNTKQGGGENNTIVVVISTVTVYDYYICLPTNSYLYALTCI